MKITNLPEPNLSLHEKDDSWMIGENTVSIISSGPFAGNIDIYTGRSMPPAMAQKVAFSILAAIEKIKST